MPADADDVLPFLATLLGLALPSDADERVRYLEPPQLRGQTFGAIARLAQAMAADRPTVLVFDDVRRALDRPDVAGPIGEPAPAN